MQISDLLGTVLVDADGKRLGVVADVRLVQDGPFIEGFGQALRLDALIVGRGGLAVRLGYIRGGGKGPWPLSAMAGWFERRAWYIPWSDIDLVDGQHRCRRARRDARRLGDVYRADVAGTGPS